jgi:hypothetical protein
MVTQEIRIFKQVQASQRIIALYPVFLYCSWQLVLLLSFPPGGASTPPFIYKGDKVTRKVTESVTT